MKWHRYAALFPMMSDDEIEALADDIRDNGQALPCLVSEAGELIDGRNRAAACALAGVEPQTETFYGDDDAILSLVISLNLPRRHLNESQRAMVAADLANVRNGSNQHAKATESHEKPTKATKSHENTEENEGRPIGRPSPQPVTEAEAAKKLNVSERSVRRAKVVKEKAAPEVQQAVREGKVSVSRAAKIADKPIEEQPAALTQAIEVEPEPNNGEGLRAKILERIGSELERQIRQLCDTEAGRNVDRAKALECLGKLVAAVKGERAPLNLVTVEVLQFPQELDRADCRAAMAKWLEYKRREKKRSYKTPATANQLLTLWARHGPAAFIWAVDRAIANTWQGLVEPEEKYGGAGKSRFGAGQSYDPSAGEASF